MCVVDKDNRYKDSFYIITASVMKGLKIYNFKPLTILGKKLY